MNGCEKLCGDCTACGPLVWALDNPDLACAHHSAEIAVAGRAIWDPSALAELLAQALRGRGVDSVAVPIAHVIHLHLRRDGNPVVEVFALILARAALLRLLAAGLCGPEEALRLLEET